MYDLKSALSCNRLCLSNITRISCSNLVHPDLFSCLKRIDQNASSENSTKLVWHSINVIPWLMTKLLNYIYKINYLKNWVTFTEVTSICSSHIETCFWNTFQKVWANDKLIRETFQNKYNLLSSVSLVSMLLQGGMGWDGMGWGGMHKLNKHHKTNHSSPIYVLSLNPDGTNINIWAY